MPQQKAIIIGAGPAGLTAALELLRNTDVKPIIYEASGAIGGISQTVKYKGNHIDIGGHRFFSKSDTVMNWWKEIMPIQGAPSCDDIEQQRPIPLSELPGAPDPEKEDRVMLYRGRLSRIFFLRKFFDYPITLNAQTILNLGPTRLVAIGLSYIKIRLFPLKSEESLEDFFINRFGNTLYKTFFKDYTEKVWGVPCNKITAEWGAQRIKGLSISSTIKHALKAVFFPSKDTDINQKGVETSLIGQFLYPKLGPGQLWELVADEVIKLGGEIHMHHSAIQFEENSNALTEVTIRNETSDDTFTATADYYFSTMPVKDLISAIHHAPAPVKAVASGLSYRDFMTVGLLVKKLMVSNKDGSAIADNWIYIQERDVKVGRLQIFNNWSPYLVADPETMWIGLEYFCTEGDGLWTMQDDDFIDFATDELAKINIIDKADVLDATVMRVPKAYPAYFGTYSEFDTIRSYVDAKENLFLIGRNGMHKYNNQDHSMLSAITAVNNLKSGITTKSNIWEVNVESEYHESK
ncbi:MAG: NAD(P)/FAD-dependent oxidoreductase [Fibrobacterales bacterium]